MSFLMNKKGIFFFVVFVNFLNVFLFVFVFVIIFFMLLRIMFKC